MSEHDELVRALQESGTAQAERADHAEQIACALAFDLGRAEWERDEATEDMFQAVADIGRAESALAAALARAEKAERDAERLAKALRLARAQLPSVSSLPRTDTAIGRAVHAADAALAAHEEGT